MVHPGKLLINKLVMLWPNPCSAAELSRGGALQGCGAWRLLERETLELEALKG